jgi:UDP-GlcNAc:undecaprenyl-phosphate GlcNAc-1-phosphate transferase
MNTSLIAFAVGLIASMGLTVPVRQLALRVGMVDQPGPRKVHVQPMPLLGGLAIYLGVLIALLVISVAVMVIARRRRQGAAG